MARRRSSVRKSSSHARSSSPRPPKPSRAGRARPASSRAAKPSLAERAKLAVARDFKPDASGMLKVSVSLHLDRVLLERLMARAMRDHQSLDELVQALVENYAAGF